MSASTTVTDPADRARKIKRQVVPLPVEAVTALASVVPRAIGRWWCWPPAPAYGKAKHSGSQQTE
ncbi:MAG: hypothetical protein JO115_02025 [Pseudonocardiales bacterium]|nr:hypothetical protein [Pseudonocardiales bacterium]